MSETIHVRSGPRMLERPAKLIGFREGMGRLFHVLDPYEHGNIPPPIRLALVDEDGIAFRMWYTDKAPKWAQQFYHARCARSHR